MALRDYNDALILNRREMIDMCINCTSPEDDCDESPCRRFRERYRALAGLPPLNDDGTEPGRVALHRLTMNGETHTLTEWAKLYGVDRNALANRILKLHWPLDRALTVPVKEYEEVGTVTIRGITRTIPEWADYLGIPKNTVYTRMRHGWSARDALFTPRGKKRRYRRMA